MNAARQRFTVAGPAGALEVVADGPELASARGLALVCHPHPLHGGTLDNKVVQTLARALVQLGWRALRFNFRGIGQSAGTWDEGPGEVDDAMAVLNTFSTDAAALTITGFSFGGYVASQVTARLLQAQRAVERTVLVGPAVQNFTVAPVPAGSLVVHGELDDVVPLSAVFDWARPHAQPVTVLPGAGHFFHGQLPALKQIVLGAWGVTPPRPSPHSHST